MTESSGSAPAAPLPPSMTSRIFDSGYRRYDGPRLGAAQAFRSLVAHTLQRIYGLHRPARTKVLPFLITILGYLPPGVFVGLAAFLPRELSQNTLPKYSDIYGFISAVLLLFVTFVAPESLCPDRRSGVLSLYLAAPLTRARYLLAKACAVSIALLFVTLGPPLLLLIGLSLQSAGPDGPGGLALVLLRILASGAFLSLYYTAVSIAAASLTDRRAVAAAGAFIFINATEAVMAILVFGLKLPDWLLAFSMTRAPFELVRRIHGEPLARGDDFHVATIMLVVGVTTVAALAAGVAWRRYRSLQVTR